MLPLVHVKLCALQSSLCPSVPVLDSVTSLSLAGRPAFIISRRWEAGGQENGTEKQWSQGRIHRLLLPDDSVSLVSTKRTVTI